MMYFVTEIKNSASTKYRDSHRWVLFSVIYLRLSFSSEKLVSSRVKHMLHKKDYFIREN